MKPPGRHERFAHTPWPAAVAKAALVGLAVVLAMHASGAAADEAPSPRTGRLELLSGSSQQAELVSLTSDGSTWRSTDGLMHVAADSLLSWGRCPAAVIGPSLRLKDGSIVAGDLVAWNVDEVVVESPLLGRVRLPLASVEGWQASAASSGSVPAGLAEPWLRIRLTNGDILRAHSVETAAGSAVARVAISSDPALREPAKTVAIPLLRVQAITARAAPPGSLDEPRAHTVAIVGLQDGSRLAVESLQPAGDPQAASLDGPSDLVLRPTALIHQPDASIRCPQNAVTGLLATGEHLMPVAWMVPADAEQTPQFGPAWPITTRTTLTGQPLAARGRPVFTGLGLHAAARVAYQLPAEAAAKGLLAAVAVDDSAGQGGSVIIRIRAGASRQTARTVFESGILRGGEPPLEIALTLDQARWLELVVEPTDDGDVLDRTIWLEPRLLMHQTSRTVQRGPSPAASDASLETSPGLH